jgi:hypothetical protein
MADRYWVGGTGAWNTTNTTNWSATSGGAGGASVPTDADNVFFNSASASGNYTVTVNSIAHVCGDLNIAKAAAGTLTFTGVANMTCSGNLNIVATGVTWSHTATLQFTLGSSGILSRTVNTGGLTLGGTIYFNAVGVTWQFQGPVATTGALQATNGTVDLNNFDWTGLSMNCGGSSSKTFAFGTSGRIVLTGNGTTVWANQLATGLFLTGTSNVTLNYAGATGTRTIAQGTTTTAPAAQVPNFNITAGTDTVAITSQTGDLNFTGFSGTLTNGARTIFGSLTISTGMSLTSGVNATTFSGTSGTKIITTAGKTIDFPVTFNGQGSTFQLAGSYTGGTTSTSVVTLSGGTLDLNGQAFTAFRFSGTGAGIRSLVATGSTFTLFGNAATILDFSTIGSLTLTGLATVTFTYAGAVGNRTITSNSGFTEAQAFNVIITGGSDTIILGGAMRDLDFTGFSGNLNSGARILYGNLTLSTGMTVVNGATSTGFANTSGTTTIDTKGRTFSQQMTFSGVGGTRRSAGQC